VRQAAQVISVVFHPLLMATYLFGILMYFLPVLLQPLNASVMFLLMIFLMTFLLPGLNFVLFRFTGGIKDLAMAERRERTLPFAFVSILYCVVTLMFYLKFPVPNIIRLMMIITALVLVSAIVTQFYKVSVHSLGVWGMIGILLPLNKLSDDGILLLPTAIAIVVAGFVMSARLHLNAHIPREVLVGAILGFVIGFGGMAILF
jgi:hypothetical protein